MATVWCFQCGLDYVETVAECVECGVSTVDYPPTPAHQVGTEHDPQMAYELHGWEYEARAEAERALRAAGIDHGWDGPSLIVLEVDEARVDELLEAIDSGEDEDEGGGALGAFDLDALEAEDDDRHDDGPGVYTVLEAIFLAADVLERHPRDAKAHGRLLEWTPVAESMRTPFGLDNQAWGALQAGARRLVDLLDAKATDEEITEEAGGLTQLLRAYV